MYKYVLLFLFLASTAFGQTTGKQLEFNSAWGVDYESNMVKNPSAAKNLNDTLKLGATLSRDTSSGNKIDGKASFLLDASALNDYLELDLHTPNDEQTSGNCGFKGLFKGDARLYRAQILDGSSNVLAQTVPLTNETGFREFRVWYPCGASGARKVRITQTEAGTAPAINVGKFYYGRMEPGAGTSPNTFSAQVSPTGVVSLENEDFINGNCVVTDTSLFTCTFNSSKFNLTPSCSATMDSTFTDALSEIVITSSSSSSYSFRTGFNNTSTSFTKAQYGFKLICTRSGSDYVQPAITPDQTDKPYTSFTPVLSTGALATGGNQKYWYMLDGPNMIMYFEYEPGANTGTAGSGTYLITVPGGYSISSTITSGNGNAANFGFVYFLKSTSNGDARAAQLTLVNSTQLAIRILNPTTDTYDTWNSTTAPLSTANMRIGFIATIPIAGRENIRSSNNPLLLNTVYADTAIKAEKSAGLTSVDYGPANGTLTAGINISSVTSTAPCQSIRVGNTVHALCSITFTCTAASGTLSNVVLAPPIPTTQGSTIRGTFSTIVNNPEWGLVNNSGNSASVVLRCGSTNADTRTVSFMYQVP